MGADLKSAYLEMRRQGEADFPPQSLEYVYRLVLLASRQGNGHRHLTAPELGRAFQIQAALDFGVLTPAVLGRWGIRTHRDLGRVVFQLARHRCLSLGEGESLEDYAHEPIQPA